MDLTQCHSWNSLPCSHQHTFSIATFYRPPATTISFDSTSSSPEKENTNSNRLGPPPLEEARRAFGPSTHYRESDRDVETELEKLPLFDLHLIDGKYVLHYDDKHNAKRLRGVIISDKRGCMLGKNIISKSIRIPIQCI